MMWQTPALGMTAQAFLLTLALSADTSRSARLLACILSFTLALMVMQLMAKHRRHEMLDSLLLTRLEEEFGITGLVSFAPHGGPSVRHANDLAAADRRLARSTPGWKRFWQLSSYEIWMLGLGLFAIVAIGVGTVSAAGTAVRLFQ